MAEEIVNLQSRFEQKKRELDYWRQARMKKIKLKYKGEEGIHDAVKYHVYYPNQFITKDGRSACSSISIIAIWKFFKETNTNLTEISWDTPVKLGAKLWRHWKDEKNTSRMFQGVHEAYNVGAIPGLRSSIKMVQEVGGTLDDKRVEEYNKDVFDDPYNAYDGVNAETDIAIYSLKQAVDLLHKEKDRRSAGTLTIREGTVSLFYDTEKFWVFDSHGGRVEEHSTLVECDSSAELCSYLRGKYPIVADSKLYNTNDTSHPNIFDMAIFERQKTEDDF